MLDLTNAPIRFGAYGDPAALPVDLLLNLASVASRRTGYTHQWRTCDQRLRAVLMASCDNTKDCDDAHAMGWRTFRVSTDGAPLDGEVVCPATTERALSCVDCGLCSGATVARPTPWSRPEGPRGPSGVVLYEGPSMLDGAPIVAVLTGLDRASKNEKTGDLLQLWILRQDVAPNDAAKDGNDASVCGACPHRRQEDGTRTCYVMVYQGPRAVWAAYKRGRYPTYALPSTTTTTYRAFNARSVVLKVHGAQAKHFTEASA
jgi:hypothetical protein